MTGRKFRAVLFDAAETLLTTRGSVGEIYGSIARRYGSTAPVEAIQAAFARQFRGAGPLSIEDQKGWWKDVVHRVFSEVGMVDNFDQFFDEVYERFRSSEGWVLFPDTIEALTDLKRSGLKLGVISNFDNRIYSVMKSLNILHFFDTAIQALGVPASEVLLVGDSLRDDVEAGMRAGLHAALLDRDNRHPGVEHVPRISSLTEALSLVS